LLGGASDFALPHRLNRSAPHRDCSVEAMIGTAHGSIIRSTEQAQWGRGQNGCVALASAESWVPLSKLSGDQVCVNASTNGPSGNRWISHLIPPP
jgi:hypothetical protein